MSNKDALESILERFSGGDLEGVLSYFSDDVEFDIQAPPGYAVSNLGKGKDELRQVFEFNAAHLDDHTYEIRNTVEEGDTTLSRGYETGTVKATGAQIAFPVVAEHRWRDGKVVFWREYYDTAQFYRDIPK